MGKQGSERPLKINTKKQRARHECMEELNAFMACMACVMDSIYVTSKKLHIACPLPQRSQFDIDERCKLERNTLMQCASAAARRPKVTNTINYHLQRIARLMK